MGYIERPVTWNGLMSHYSTHINYSLSGVGDIKNVINRWETKSKHGQRKIRSIFRKDEPERFRFKMIRVYAYCEESTDTLILVTPKKKVQNFSLQREI